MGRQEGCGAQAEADRAGIPFAVAPFAVAP